jgi:thiol-disulfide isomerase/thioredoxin
MKRHGQHWPRSFTRVVHSLFKLHSAALQHWCGPCKLVLPSVEWAAKEYDGQIKVVKVEADSNKDLVEKFKVGRRELAHALLACERSQGETSGGTAWHRSAATAAEGA